MDIKALARELKKTNKENVEKNVGTLKKSKPVSLKKPVKSKPVYGKGVLQTFIDAANARDNLKLNRHLYMDDDTYDILWQLKGRSKLVIGNLVSVILENFILEHKAEFLELLKPKENRLLK